MADLKLRLKLDTTRAANPALGDNWLVTKDWNEVARYEQKTEAEAKVLFEAVTDHATGVLQWIKIHW